MHGHRRSFIAYALAMGSSLATFPIPAHALSGKSWSLAASGDNLGNVVVTNDPSTMAVWDIVRAADFGFFNLGGQIFNLANYTGYEASENGGDNNYGGFNLASHANNHAWDFDLEGMEATHRYLNDAGPGNSSIRPRPGVSALRAQAVPRVNETAFEHIKAVARLQDQTSVTLTEDVTAVTFYIGQHPVFYPNILASIREAKANSDAAIFSLHAHKSDSGAYDSDIPMNWDATVPASYTQNISRAVIDAGADVVLVHGPHHLRGIEIHNGRPIFYSLSSLTYNLGLNFRGFNLPLEWDDGMIATVHFEDDALAGVMLHPIVHSQLQNDTSLPDKMMPKLAPRPEAIRILGHLQRASEPFGTVIDTTTMTTTHEAVSAKDAPIPLPQFSQAIRHEGKVYVSGNIGILPGTQSQLVEGTVKERATQAIRNIKAVLEAAGTTLEHVIKMNIYITTMANFALVNEAYDQFFTWDLKPARTCVAVHELPFGTDVEIECIAYIP
ncbi:hypothetical protein B0T11DRAFT_323481 [Plectosphaerella cucumerina]|uniref:Capsule synthesis protein CapA domain-containing protein n=1 Tax=Plectosphaerella cucumerina TaxID=40658 RepID=A0A8K0TRS3_9PEZI|nr:hypothetical protein B0T11DRAFT_323481 [Plectosphaerella cucumerina]